MPTNEERREIARRLRNFEFEMLEALETLDTDSNAVLMLYTLALIICGDDEATGKEVMDRLADLIEPEPERTCCFHFDHLDGNGSSWEACDACHALFPGVDMSLEFAYCPTCGAKVVSKDGD